MIKIKEKETGVTLEDINDFGRELNISYKSNKLSFSLNTPSPYKLFIITEDDKELYYNFETLFYEYANSLIYEQLYPEDNYDFINYLQRYNHNYPEIYEDGVITLINSDYSASLKMFFSNNEVLIAFGGISSDNMSVSIDMQSALGDFYMPLLRLYERLLSIKSPRLVKTK